MRQWLSYTYRQDAVLLRFVVIPKWANIAFNVIHERNVNMKAFDDFVGTIACLRSPEGCPWDREQTHASIGRSMIEEAYEALDAIERNDVNDLREELGDVLLQVVLHSQIASDEGEFTIEEVCQGIDAKMIRRHPHVFGEKKVSDAADVEVLWEAVKQEEKGSAHELDPGLLGSIPQSLPALLQIQKMMKRIKREHPEAQQVDPFDQAQAALDMLRTAEGEKAGNVAAGLIEALAVISQEKAIDLESVTRARCQVLREKY